ncbi:MAG: hypothetical protein CBE33_01070 [Candidatus Pelagibacter sp. TMED273]|nr:MAG: hypothetical protein CBE33_01070 [Candidatus Pelagibacter sp. TMED273]|tara:strand:- start:2134 stop:2520 length:387 start_codon:yes stop_codon:yes gene_type:complete
MNKALIRIIIISILNFYTLKFSPFIDVDQFKRDIDIFYIFQNISYGTVFIIVSIAVALLTVMLILFFKPFIEVYLIFHLKISFYFFINLVSISTIYLAFRVYGYSRLMILIYLLVSTFSLIISDKVKK